MTTLVKGATKCLQVGAIAAALATCQLASADTIYHTIKRVKKSKPVTSMQVMNYLNSNYDGHPIRFKKTPKAKFPDCHTIRYLTFEGELHTFKISCRKK